MKNFAIWGKAPDQSEQCLLYDGGDTEYTAEMVEKISKILVEKHGCTDLRVQIIDLDNPTNIIEDFVRCVRI